MAGRKHALLRPLPGEVVHPRHEAIPLGDRFWPKVGGSWLPGVEQNDCWLWLGLSRTGRWRIDKLTGRRVKAEVPYDYGRIHAPTPGASKRIIGAHVAAYELVHGEVPEGRVVAHTCDVGLCCNPWHLVALTVAENNEDCRLKGRMRRRRQEVAA